MLPIELICNVTGFPTWNVTINGDDREITPNTLAHNGLAGHDSSGPNILINVPVNNTRYICVSNEINVGTPSDPAFVYIAGKYVKVITQAKVLYLIYTHNVQGYCALKGKCVCIRQRTSACVILIYVYHLRHY